MTDEKAKEEFEKWVSHSETSPEADILQCGMFARAGFYAGFRIAERLSKIEALEDMLRMMDKLRFFSICDYKDAKNRIDAIIDQLKASN